MTLAARAEAPGEVAAQADALDELSHRDRLYDVAAHEGALFVVGHPGVLLRSKDGGKSFEWLKAAKKRGAFFSIAFNRKGLGVALGLAGTALVTEDGGASWSARAVAFGEERPNLFAVAVLDSGVIVAVGEFGAIARSVDAGQSWQRVSYDVGGDEDNDAPAELPPPECATFDDVGDENADAIGEARLTDLAFAYGGNTGFIVGEFGLILRTTDAGLTFERLSSCTGKTLYALDVISPEHMLVVGSDALVLESRDGGAHFERHEVPTKEHLFGVFAHAERALLMGAQGALLVREGEGPFTERRTGVHTWLGSAHLDAQGRGIVVGGRAHLLHTVDGGRTFERLRGD